MYTSNIEAIVANVVKDFKFEKISDLSKDEFTKLLSKAISESIKTSLNEDFIIKTVEDELRIESRRR